MAEYLFYIAVWFFCGTQPKYLVKGWQHWTKKGGGRAGEEAEEDEGSDWVAGAGAQLPRPAQQVCHHTPQSGRPAPGQRQKTMVGDQQWFNADPNSVFFLIADPEPDPDPNADPDPVQDPGFWWPEIEKNLWVQLQIFFYIFFI